MCQEARNERRGAKVNLAALRRVWTPTDAAESDGHPGESTNREHVLMGAMTWPIWSRQHSPVVKTVRSPQWAL